MQHACSTVSSERGKSTFLVGERGSPQHCTAGYRWMQAWWLTRPAFNQVRGLTWFAHAIREQPAHKSIVSTVVNSLFSFEWAQSSTMLNASELSFDLSSPFKSLSLSLCKLNVSELSFDLSSAFKWSHCEIVWHCLKLNFVSFYFSLFIEQCSVPSAYFEPSLTVLTL